MKMFEKTDPTVISQFILPEARGKLCTSLLVLMFYLVVNFFPKTLKELENIEKLKVGIIKLM